MKHIRKKFLRERKVNFDPDKFRASVTLNDDDIASGYKVMESETHYPVILTTQNELIQGFLYKTPDRRFVIPEPNLITVYFDIAQSQINLLFPAKLDLLRNIESSADLSTTLNNTHTFFHHSCICIMFMHNSLEAFINLLLPIDKVYVKEGDKNTSHYNHEQIQKNISLEEKIKSVIPQFTNKSFHTSYGHKYETLLKLKALRDEIAHTKAHAENDNPNYYKQIFTSLLDFDYNMAIHCVRDFINYYQPSLVEECNCGRKE